MFRYSLGQSAGDPIPDDGTNKMNEQQSKVILQKQEWKERKELVSTNVSIFRNDSKGTVLIATPCGLDNSGRRSGFL